METTDADTQPVPPTIVLTSDPLDAAAVRALYDAVAHPGAGGIVTFEGVVRDNNKGKRIRYLEYEAYPGMAEAELQKIADEVADRWPGARLAMAHRVGRLHIGECSVVVVAACAHRAEAFEACRYAIDTLKARVPIWKKEVADDGEEWIESHS